MLRSNSTVSLTPQTRRSRLGGSRPTLKKTLDRHSKKPSRQISRTFLKSWWISLVWWAFVWTPASALELRVAVRQDVSELTVGSSTPARIRDSSGNVLGNLTGMHAHLARSSEGSVALSQWQAGRLWIEPSDRGYVYIGDRWYRGKVLLVPRGYGMTAVNYVDIESYIYSVLGAEMSPNWPREALKAQAVAARSYVLYQRQRYGNDVYDVGDDTFWQVYRGMEEEAAATHAATHATRGQVLSHDGKVIEAVFHSSSGGHTEDAEVIWDEAKPYLRGVPDFDRQSPNYQWTETLSQWDVTHSLSGVGNVYDMKPEQMTPNGRIVMMKVIGDGGTAMVDGDSIRSALGLRSSLFTVTSYGGYFTISGRGFGHGVGMSQWGAKYLAEQGYDYRQILSHYYRDTYLAQIRVP
ncbi:SpoIID/LytB domain-containing protein [Geitlerinema sp. CS-897]|nr:SpoIID/LytB domain-containing protein [Geitlerinema sp. CS-897]